MYLYFITADFARKRFIKTRDVARTLSLGGAEAHGERGARAYNGGLGAEPPAGSRGRAVGRSVEAANFPHSMHFETAHYRQLFIKKL